MYRLFFPGSVESEDDKKKTPKPNARDIIRLVSLRERKSYKIQQETACTEQIISILVVLPHLLSILSVIIHCT